MNPALTLVTERLPNLRELTVSLFERDHVFRDLCEEYQVCSEAAARMGGAAGARPPFRNEYLALRLRLEAELLRYLAEHPES